MPDQEQRCHTDRSKTKVVVLHPIISDYVKRTQKVLKENGSDASFSVAINAMLLMAIMESKRPEGLSKETLEAVKDFVDDDITIRELASMESELNFLVKPRAESCYIS
jgi:hypothetical protein